jgi:hypothetical protein
MPRSHANYFKTTHPPKSQTYDENQERLQRLRGLPCPECRINGLAPLPLVWTGIKLICDAHHCYSNPNALMDDIRRMPTAPPNPRRQRKIPDA